MFWNHYQRLEHGGSVLGRDLVVPFTSLSIQCSIFQYDSHSSQHASYTSVILSLDYYTRKITQFIILIRELVGKKVEFSIP